METERQEVLERFPSKKNRVVRVRGDDGGWVEKAFRDPAGFLTEKQMGDIFEGTGLPTPRRLSVNEEGLFICYEYIDARPVVDLIESADEETAADIIGKICDWLSLFYRICREKTGQQYIWGDIHLRNLLYEEETGIIYGVDFEECRRGRMETDAARIYVFLLHYAPAFTERKRALAVLLRTLLTAGLELNENFLEREIQRETEELLRRRNGPKEPASKPQQ